MRTPLIALAVLASTVLQAQSPGTYHRGELVRVRDVAKPAVLTIVGIPDDIVQADESGVYINDLGEERLNQDITEHLGIHPAGRIERAQ